MKEEKTEVRQEIVVLDEGIEGDALLGSESFCCGAVFIFIFG